MGDLADQHNNIIQIGTGFEIQVIDGYSSGISAAMSSGGGTGYFVGPFLPSSADQASEAVDIRVNHHMQLMSLRSGDFFCGKRFCLYFYIIFLIICCIHVL